jgi:hypothetical protein
VATGAGFAAPANAGVVVFDNVKGAWKNPAPQNGITVSNGSPTATASWGSPAEQGGKKSSYAFTAYDATTGDLGDGDTSGALKLGLFQHNNWPITGTSLSSIVLTFTADIFIDGVLFDTKSFDFMFNHHETPNDGTGRWGACAYGGYSGDNANKYGCSDKVTMTTMSDNNQFTVGRDTYTVNLAGFLVGNKLVDQFITKESGVKKKKYGHGYDYFEQPNKAYIMANVSMVTSAIPEPGTWALMIAGFGAVGTMVRANRRRTALAV